MVKEEKGSEVLCHTWIFQVHTVQGDVALQGKTFHSAIEAKGVEWPESDKQGVDVATLGLPILPAPSVPPHLQRVLGMGETPNWLLTSHCPERLWK